MKTVDIKGKQYVEVNERLKYFREHFKGYSLLSSIVSTDNGICNIKAIIINNEGIEVANGLAYEKEGSTFINKTSYIENCETSAWGRALANFGIGIDGTVASADEVKNAIEQQETKPPKKDELSPKEKLTAKLNEVDFLINNKSRIETFFKEYADNELKINNFANNQSDFNGAIGFFRNDILLKLEQTIEKKIKGDQILVDSFNAVDKENYQEMFKFYNGIAKK